MAMTDARAASGGDDASLGAQIAGMIARLPPDHVTLGELLELFGDEGLLLLCILLTLVFLIPVSIPGVSTVFGARNIIICPQATPMPRMPYPARVPSAFISASLHRTPEHSHEERNDERDQEDEEQELGEGGGHPRRPTEPQGPRDQGEHHGPHCLAGRSQRRGERTVGRQQAAQLSCDCPPT